MQIYKAALERQIKNLKEQIRDLYEAHKADTKTSQIMWNSVREEFSQACQELKGHGKAQLQK